MQNLWWAAGYNIAAIPLAAGVLAGVGIVLHPAVGAAHVGEPCRRRAACTTSPTHSVVALEASAFRAIDAMPGTVLVTRYHTPFDQESP